MTPTLVTLLALIGVVIISTCYVLNELVKVNTNLEKLLEK